MIRTALSEMHAKAKQIQKMKQSQEAITQPQASNQTQPLIQAETLFQTIPQTEPNKTEPATQITQEIQAPIDNPPTLNIQHSI